MLGPVQTPPESPTLPQQPLHAMDESHQIDIPESFLALHVLPGKVKPSLPWHELLARYELCEDLAQMLTEPTTTRQFQQDLLPEAALQLCLQGLHESPGVVSPAEARWVVTRLAELLEWPAPEEP